jgi:hypothetical protein
VIVGAFVSIRIMKNMDYITKRFSK